MKERLAPLMFIAALLAGCATQTQDPTAPANFGDSTTEPGAPPPPAPGAQCASPECADWCKDAGELEAACADAFAKGCASDTPPEPAAFNCDWRQAPAELRSEETDSAAPAEDSSGARGKEEKKASDQPDQVRTVPNAD